MNPTGFYQDNITDLPTLGRERYERIFKVYTLLTDKGKSYYFYNILKKVSIPNSIDEELFGKIWLDRKLPWTTFSYKLYGTTHLWWLLSIINKPKNIFIADAGIEYKFIKARYIDLVLTNIEEQINI